MAIAGALALGVSAVVGIGFAVAKGLKKWSFHIFFTDCLFIPVYIPKLFNWFSLRLLFVCNSTILYKYVVKKLLITEKYVACKNHKYF